MTTTLDIIRDAHRLLGITVVAHNDQEMLRLLNQMVEDLQCDFESVAGINKLTGEK